MVKGKQSESLQVSNRFGGWYWRHFVCLRTGRQQRRHDALRASFDDGWQSVSSFFFPIRSFKWNVTNYLSSLFHLQALTIQQPLLGDVAAKPTDRCQCPQQRSFGSCQPNRPMPMPAIKILWYCTTDQATDATASSKDPLVLHDKSSDAPIRGMPPNQAANWALAARILGHQPKYHTP